jgi:hypothetical protein
MSAQKRSWRPVPPTHVLRPQVPESLRDEISAQAAEVVADLKKRFCKQPKHAKFNWPTDLFARWHRNALYFVAVMCTPHGRPPTFEIRVARMEHCGGGKFDVAVPMRRGWNTFKRKLSPSDCLMEIGRIRF